MRTRHPFKRESVLYVTAPYAHCKIIVAGPLSECWSDYLGDLLVDAEVEKGHVRTSTLIGQPYDLAAFIGMLNVLSNLGYTVIATEYQQNSAGDTVATNSAVVAHH